MHRVLMLMVRQMMRLMLLRMVVRVMVIHGGIEFGRAAGISGYAIGNGRLHFTASVYGGRLMTVLGHVNHASRRVGPVPVDDAGLTAVVGRIPDIHPVEGWKSGVWHTLRWLTGGRRASIMWRRYTLPKTDHRRVARVRVNDPVTLSQHRGAVVLVLLVRMFGRNDAAVTHI